MLAEPAAPTIAEDIGEEHVDIVAGRLEFAGMVLRMDGSEAFESAASGAIADAAKLGEQAGRDILGRLPPGVLADKV